MISTHSLVLGLAAALTLLPVSDAPAGPATDQLRTSVDLVVKILSDPELKKEARSLERRRAIRAVADQIFDFGEISRGARGVHASLRRLARAVVHLEDRELLRREDPVPRREGGR